MIKNILKQFIPAITPKQKARKQFYSINLQQTDIVIDCGANVGRFTEYLCKTGATVYSFEPNPYAFKVLQDRFAAYSNVHCIQKGVSDIEAKAKLYLHENSGEDEIIWSTGSSLLSFKENVLSDKYVTVELIDLCEFIQSLNQQIRILKLDVEGVECPILRKIISTGINKKIDYTFVETHDHKIPELIAETNALRELIKNRKIGNINLNWT